MFKSVLIISDNKFLANQFNKIILKKKFRKTNFCFSKSKFSIQKKDNDRDENNFSFNLKNQEDLNFIISNFDLVISIHCKQLFPSQLFNNIKCINVHPGYNPINRGWYPQVFSIINKLPIGATIHEIDKEIDHGGIIAREFVSKFNFDTSETLYNRILSKELELLELHIESIISNNYTLTIPDDEGNLYLKKDFNNLLNLDLEEKMTMGEFLNKLRALTHGNFNNAYFIDPDTKKKYFIGITIKPEKNQNES